MNASGVLEVPPMSARAFILEAGRTIRIVDIAGCQAGDLVAFSVANPAVRLSQARTRVENGCVAITTGARLWSNTLPPQPMLTVVEDTVGGHDLLYPPCCRYALEKRFGVSRDGCLEHLADALRSWDIPLEQIPGPLNLFFRVDVDAAGAMSVRPPASMPGSTIALRAELPCIVAISTCSVPVAGRDNTGYRIVIQ